MKISLRRHVRIAIALLTLAYASPAMAQKVTTVPDLTGKQVLEQLANQGAGGVSGDSIAAATAIDVATMPFGTSSGGFEFKLDPATGLLARTTTSFGPSFVERALTAAGHGALTMVLSGAVTRIESSVPALLGMVGATTHFTPNAV